MAVDLRISASTQARLCAIADHHRDREELPWQFLSALASGGHSDPLVASNYRDAVSDVGGIVASLSSVDTNALRNDCLRFVGIEFIPDTTAAELSKLPSHVRLAHAVVHARIRSLFYDRARYLQEGIPSDSRLLDARPDLRSHFTDRDFLFPLSRAERCGATWIVNGSHDLQLNPLLGRATGEGLFTTLEKQHRSGHRVGVAVDHYRVVPRDRSSRRVLLDQWFGSPFRPANWDDPRDVGHTAHVRTRDIGESPSDKSGLRTEFWRTFDEPHKTFEAAELPGWPLADGVAPQAVACRYVHAMRNVRTGQFEHLDGAIHVYESESYRRRYESVGQHGERIWASRKIKLFRVDARDGLGIDVPDWQSMIEMFFFGNELVLEYLSGRTYSEIYRDRYGREHPFMPSSKST